MGWFGRNAAAAAFYVCCSAGVAADPVNTDVTKTDIVVEADGSYTTTMHSERHAVNDTGAMTIARVSLPYNAAMDRLEVVEAYTLKADGSRIPLDPTEIVEQMQPDAGQYSIYADLRVKVLQFPQFAIGDTAVFTTRSVTARSYFPGRFMFDATFRNSPVLKEETDTISVPRTMALQAEVEKVDETKRVEGERTIYTFHYKQAEFKAPDPSNLQSLISSILVPEKLPHYGVSNFRDYADLGRAYGELAEPKLAVTANVAALADRIAASAKDRRDEVRKIYVWVAKNIRYVAIELGRGSFEPHDVDHIIANGYGDCKDHDILLRALLKAKGIAADSILINSRAIYTLSKAPGYAELNHVITYVPELDVYLDSSNPLAPFAVLGSNLYGKPAVRVSANTAVEVVLPPPPLSVVHTEVVAKIDKDGAISGTLKTASSGPASLASRSAGMIVQTLGADKASALKLISLGLHNPTGTTRADPPFDLAETYTTSTQFVAKPWEGWLAGSAARQLPGATTFLTGEAAAGTAGFAAKKTDAIACASVHATEDVSLMLPETYTATPHLPADTQVDSATLSFTAHWSYAGHTLSLHRDLSTKFATARCSGQVNIETAEALAKAKESYKTKISLNPSATASAGSETSDADSFKAAIAALKANDHKTAQRILTELLSHPQSDHNAFSAHMDRGISFLRTGQLNAAIEDFTAAIGLQPEGEIAPYQLRAQAYLRSGHRKEALADLDVVIRRSPEDIMAREAHADAATAAGAFKAAVEDYDTILKIKPDDQRVVLMRAVAHFGAKMYVEAAEDYDHAGKLGANEMTVLNGLCDSLARTSKLSDAANDCTRALQINPLAGVQLESRGIVYFRQGKFGRALEDFDKAATTYPQVARYLYERGVTKVKLGDTKDGERDIEKAKAVSPDVTEKVPGGIAL